VILDSSRGRFVPMFRGRLPGLRLTARAAGCVLTLLLGAAPARAASGPPPRLETHPAEVAADDQLMWNFELKLVNSTSGGLYVDSVSCRYEDTGRGQTGAGRVQVVPMPAIAQSIGTMSAGDSAQYQQMMPAVFEDGLISFRLHGRRADGTQVTVESAPMKVVPGPVSAEHPSEFLTVAGKKLEVVLFPSAKDGPSPGLLYVHGEGAHARLLLATGRQLAARGFTVLFASLPGYGLSEGTDDDGGPQAVAALAAALDRLKRAPGVDAARLGAWGVSRGARAVANLAARRSDLAAIVAQSGRYDAASAGKVRASTLVLHGGLDAEAPVDQARAFAAAVEKAGVHTVETMIVANGGHVLPRGDVQRSALAFLGKRLTP